MEPYTTGKGQRMAVHDAAECAGEHCVIHNPSEHGMRQFPTYWRDDGAFMERICPHGIGHPDPDDLAHRQKLQPFVKHFGIHGCDGCCCDTHAKAA